MANTDETTQVSLRLMDGIRKSRLFTIPTAGDFKKLTQRDTNHCVAIAAMRLVCFALDEFLDDSKHWQKDINKQKLESIRQKIIHFPKVENRNEQDEPLFIQKLLAICCGVISPKSLNGLNHCNLDNDFQIANQEQNIGMLLRYPGFQV